MKSFFVFILYVAAAVTFPAEKDAVVLQYDSENSGIDGYKYTYETSNGIVSQEEGHLRNIGTDDEVLDVRGSFQYPGVNGKLYLVTYEANENGFQAFGTHLPRSQ
ncbi:unnamed protein product [Pieris macdunnoughi]|uniref:Uncharacterized protein n=1 Tax=Pieris macdunnoughi TaxID=345717 RepID=A0A821PZB9_9NEOP|nr:unnamed protein product [Pieris macdunnoughi]